MTSDTPAGPDWSWNLLGRHIGSACGLSAARKGRANALGVRPQRIKKCGQQTETESRPGRPEVSY